MNDEKPYFILKVTTVLKGLAILFLALLVSFLLAVIINKVIINPPAEKVLEPILISGSPENNSITTLNRWNFDKIEFIVENSELIKVIGLKIMK